MKKIFILIIIIFMILGIGYYSIRNVLKENYNIIDKKENKISKAEEKELIKEIEKIFKEADNTIIKVNDEEISKVEKKFLELQKIDNKSINKDDIENKIIEEKVILQTAIKEGFDLTESDKENVKENIKKSMEKDINFKKKLLEKTNMNEDEFLDYYISSEINSIINLSWKKDKLVKIDKR